MQHQLAPFPDPASHLARVQPDRPTLYFAPARLHEIAARFRAGFPGLVTYAVKANDRPEVLATLAAAGITAFDVASPAEMDAVRAVCAGCALHYNNPVRSPAEIAAGIARGVASWSVDSDGELAKLDAVPRGAEVAVRFALPVEGAAYDFGSKFGAAPDAAAALLAKVARMSFTPALCFHPGTQCLRPEAWCDYIAEAARIADRAGVRIARLNVGGGFAACRGRGAPDLDATLQEVARAHRAAFGASGPALICEPGRGMVAEAFALAVRVKALRPGEAVLLNDGIYGGLADLRDMGPPERTEVLSPEGAPRLGPPRPRTVFGPTCDSLDRLPGTMDFPSDMEEGDYILLPAMGAYSIAMSTRFNGYGLSDIVTVRRLP